MFDLVFLTGARAGVVLPAEDGSVVAGREPECEVNVPDPQVSRAHARFEWDGQRFRVVDAKSSNGTFVNERLVRDSELSHGDVVRMGSTRLRVVRRDASRRVLNGGASATNGASAVTARAATDRHAGRRSSMFGVEEDVAPEFTHSVAIDGFGGSATGTAVRTSLDEEVRTLRLRLESMVRVAGQLAKADNQAQLLETAMDALFELLPQTGRAFLLLGGAAEDLEPAAVRDRSSRKNRLGPSRQLRVSRSICRAALERREAVLYREGGPEGAFDASQSIVDLEIRSALAVPLIVGTETVGVVVLDTRDMRKPFREGDLELAASVCQQIAVAVRNLQLVAQVEQQTRTRDNLMRFLPKPMADQVLAGAMDAGLGGKKYRGTVMFADVIGFTARSERTEPSQLVASMNEYFERVAPCVLSEDGSIDKFMGDAIMAVWGIPVAQEDADIRAVLAALRMQTRVLGLNARVEDPFCVGIGIHSGELVAGNIGSDERREYTVLGDTVNTAQRLETIASVEQILVTQAVWDSCNSRLYGVRMDQAKVKNKTVPVQPYSVRGVLHPDAGEVQLFVPVSVQRDGESVDAQASTRERGWLIRRLADESFIGLFPGPVALDRGAVLVADAPEWHGAELGMLSAVATVATEAEDGGLARCRLELSRADLGGFLASAGTALDAQPDIVLDRGQSLARWIPT